MRLVVPVSRSDMHLLPEFVELHQHLKTAGLNHTLHFVVPHDLQSEAEDARVQCNGLFENITVHTMTFVPYGGWPYAPNMYFWACADAMRRDNKTLPWQLVELDCRPLVANAYDVIAARYASCGAPFFGYVGKTPWRTETGKITKSLWGDGDLMMSGCAVYPGNLQERPQFTGLMEDFMKGEMSIGDPWDMHLRSAMKAEGIAHTELIGNHWNTGNYRIENGRMVCDALPTHEIYTLHPEWEKRDCGGAVHHEAVMVHGCKDESLVKLVMGGGLQGLAQQTVRLPERQTARQDGGPTQDVYLIPPLPTAAEARIEKLEGMMGQMMELMLAAAGKAAVSQQDAGAPRTDPDAGAVAQPPSYEPGLIPRILEAIPEVGGSEALSALSKKLSTKKLLVQQAVEASGKLTLKGDLVERTAA